MKIACALMIMGMLAFSSSTYSKDEEVTRLEFVKLMVANQSQSKVVPANASSLSDDQLYDQVAQNLKSKGFNILTNKDPDKVLTQQEFVRLTYAFSDQPSGKSLFEQKLYLKKANIIDTADVGLTTGLQGRAVQFRGEGDEFTASALAAPVFMQDRVETDLESMITFTFDDGSTMSLGEDAVVNITEHIYDPERDFRKTIVNVALGAVRFKVTKGKAEGSMFQVITPVATAGVRGTEFVTIVEPGGKTKFVGLEGRVETFPRLPNGKEGKHEFVVAGTMHDIAGDGASSGLQQVSAPMMKQVIQKTDPEKKLDGPPAMTMAKVMNAVNADLNVETASGKESGKGNKKSKNAANKAGKAAESAAGSAAKAAAKDAAKVAAKDAARNAAKDVARKAAKDAAMQAAKASIVESTNQIVQTSGNLSGGNPNPVGNPNVEIIDPAGFAEGIGGGGVGGGVGGGLPGLGGGLPPGLGGGGGPPCGIPPCGKGKGKGKGKGLLP